MKLIQAPKPLGLLGSVVGITLLTCSNNLEPLLPFIKGEIQPKMLVDIDENLSP